MSAAPRLGILLEILSSLRWNISLLFWNSSLWSIGRRGLLHNVAPVCVWAHLQLFYPSMCARVCLPVHRRVKHTAEFEDSDWQKSVSARPEARRRSGWEKKKPFAPVIEKKIFYVVSYVYFVTLTKCWPYSQRVERLIKVHFAATLRL